MTAFTHTYGKKRSSIKASDARIKRLSYFQSPKSPKMGIDRSPPFSIHDSARRRENDHLKRRTSAQYIETSNQQSPQHLEKVVLPSLDKDRPSSSIYASSDDLALDAWESAHEGVHSKLQSTPNKSPAVRSESQGSVTPGHVGKSRVQSALVAGSNEATTNTGSITPDSIRTAAANYDANDKVLAMLAATSALKPVTPTSSITKSVRPRMLVRVSDAWDRVSSPRGSINDNKARRKLKKQSYLAPNPAQSDACTQLPAVSNVEMRVNEGHNLSRQKVQKMVGGSIARKPVAGVCHEPRPDISEEHLQNMESSIDSMALLEVSFESDDGEIPTNYSDPFASEPDFDSHLDDSILSLSPSGASTPRNEVSNLGGFVSSEQHSPTKQIKSSSPQYARLQRRHLDSKVIPTYGNEQTLVLGKRVKKHPSPSKTALEDLEKAFQGYNKLQSQILADPQLDELAISFVTPQTALTQRDANQPVGRRGPLEPGKNYRGALYRSATDIQYLAGSHHGQMKKANFGIGCDKIDELCV